MQRHNAVQLANHKVGGVNSKRIAQTYRGLHTHKWVREPDRAWHCLMGLGMVPEVSSIYDHSMTTESRVPTLDAQRLVLDAV